MIRVKKYKIHAPRDENASYPYSFTIIFIFYNNNYY